jgi:hypothetical protein
VNLDKAHRTIVSKVTLAVKPRTLELTVHASDEIDIELAAAKEATAMLEQAFGRKMSLRAAVAQPQKL